MATRTLKIGLSATDRQNMAQDVYDRLIDTVFEDYSSSSTYNVGDYAVYNNVLYRCVTAIATPEAWDSSKWEVATFQDLVDDVNEAVVDVNQFADTKQDTLVSGENIKTINGTSLLGSGDYAFDNALNEASTNALQNKVITEYIYDLESKVSTLAVKVYNHDIALGTLNIENVLYSVENADSFAIPTTIGANADVVIPKSRMALNTIKGKTEYSRNLFRLFDTEEKSITYNGLNFVKSKDGFITIKGTTTSQINESLFTILGYDRQTLEQGKTYSYKIEASGTYDDGMLFSFDGYETHYLKNLTNGIKQSTFTCNNENVYDAIHMYAGVNEAVDVKFRIMFIQGSTAPTTFVPYYTGLKNVELNSLKVYGKTDNYTELHVGDKVTNFTISFGRLWFQETGSPENNNVVWINNNTTIYLSKTALSGIGVSMIKINGIDVTLTGQHAVKEGDLITIDKVLTTSRIAYLIDTPTKFQNATSVKSILPSSILPKTLPAYERLEVVDNGDDTYKIDLVSHAELHVGDKINSLWVGNPQSNQFQTFPVIQSNCNYGIFSISDLTDSSRLRCAGLQTSDYPLLISNYSEVKTAPDISQPVLGGDDTYVNGSTTFRNGVIKFSTNISILEIADNSGTFKSNFRNGEETRTTLIDGLSLDDVSAIIDTNDVVYADNSNAEYDVSIAETSVELLVNKN